MPYLNQSEDRFSEKDRYRSKPGQWKVTVVGGRGERVQVFYPVTSEKQLAQIIRQYRFEGRAVHIEPPLSPKGDPSQIERVDQIMRSL